MQQKQSFAFFSEAISGTNLNKPVYEIIDGFSFNQSCQTWAPTQTHLISLQSQTPKSI